MGGLTSPLWFPFVNALPGQSGLSDLLLGRDAFWFDLAVNLVAGRRRRDQPGPEVVTQLFGRRRAAQDPLASLTPREQEVLELMAQGFTNSGIARELVVTEGAVEKHSQRIFAKLGLGETDQHRRVRAVLAWLKRQ